MTADFETRLAALEREVAHQRDHLAILQLIAAYGPLADAADNPARADKVAALWLEDGVYEIGGYGAQHGRAAIADTFKFRNPDASHFMGPAQVSIDGDRAVALHYSCVFRAQGDDRFYPWRVAVNRWELQREQDGWKVRRRINCLMNGNDEALALLRGLGHHAAS